MKYSFVYPNQLFDVSPCFSRNRSILLIEDPLFFGDKTYTLNFHKQKILLHYLSIRYYEKKLKKYGYNVEIVSYLNLKNKSRYTEWIFKKYNIEELHLVDVVDYELRRRITHAANHAKIKIKWYDNPNFFLNNSDVIQDFGNKKFHSMQLFYKKQRKRNNILIGSSGNPIGGQWSFDKENRKKLPKDIKLPKEYKFDYDSDILRDAKIYIDQNFRNNYGAIEDFNYPINHAQAQKSFNNFLNNKFELFGPYEDAISNKDSTLFHSVLTPYLNIGLISPKEIIYKTITHANENSVSINSLEGFIRQIIGWREFIRGIYETNGTTQRTNNFWNYKKTMPQSFYSGNTSIEPVDNCIERLNKNAYLHHIERLMILGNIFCLLRINPDEVYNWFMELFIDAYDWVMVPNVYGMSQFSDGGIMATKPYISGSNYILKMSNYKKGNWSEIWDALYWTFINDNRDFFKKNPRMSMMTNIYDKKSEEMKLEYIRLEKNLKL